MADKHPYSPSGGGATVQAVNQLRKTFPSSVTSGTLKKLNIAPNNESYVIGILRFINVIDESGAKSAQAGPIFSMHDDNKFQKAFGGLVEEAYKDLFDVHGPDAWTLSLDDLISFFRGADQTSEVVGKRQAQTFRALASLSGYGDPVKPAESKPASGKSATKAATAKKPATPVSKQGGAAASTTQVSTNPLGLTVRIEINLPAGGDQDTYDRIFKSIRENLLRG